MVVFRQAPMQSLLSPEQTNVRIEAFTTKLIEELGCKLANSVRIPSGRTAGHHLKTRICGLPLHVESERTALCLSPEALSSALLLPAAAKSKSLKGESIDSAWLDGANKILAQAQAWWGWHAQRPCFTPSSSTEHSNSGIGLAFSLGVDSFYSCFFANPAPNLLILAGGFDVEPERKNVLLKMQDSVADVAETTGKEWTMVTTDLRRHWLYRKSSWDQTHGGALAFLGHLLERHIGTLLISSSSDEDHLGPWGSHPDIDSFWSSGRVAIRHVGHEVYRSEKLRRLVSHPIAAPLLQRHLRVCYDAPSERGNCGRCHKCVLTRINLHRDMPNFRLETMPEDVPLAEAIEALSPITNVLVLNLRKELLGCPDPKVERALQDLIRRSETTLLNK
jgi:hypothetical protein